MKNKLNSMNSLKSNQVETNKFRSAELDEISEQQHYSAKFKMQSIDNKENFETKNSEYQFSECPKNSAFNSGTEEYARPKAKLHGLSQSKEPQADQSEFNFKKKPLPNNQEQHENTKLREQIMSRSQKIAALEKKLQYIESREKLDAIDRLEVQKQSGESFPVESTRFITDFQNIEEKFKRLNIQASDFDTNDLSHAN